MQIEIDTSSRLDKSGDTIFGFSNHIQEAILLKQTTRDECLEILVGRRLSKELRIFSACIYLLIKDHLDEITKIRIDQEYPMHEGEIKRYLANLIEMNYPDAQFLKVSIEIVPIGKISRAHEIAWKTFRKQRKADRVIKTKDILNLLTK
jgi:hypothetical protein